MSDEGESLKRKLKDQEESPSKRMKTGKVESNPETNGKALPSSSDNHQGRGRENTRVKEFPAGNVTTSSSRISFLQSLCKVPKYLSLVDLVPILVSLKVFKSNFSHLIIEFSAQAFGYPWRLPSLGFLEKQRELLTSGLSQTGLIQKGLIYCRNKISGLQHFRGQ